MSSSAIQIPRDKISQFCQRHHIAKLALFGSVLRKDFGPGSDIDVLVEFEEGHVPGFIRLYQLEKELSQIMGHRELDLVTPKTLNYRIRDQILNTAEVQYVKKR